MTARRRALLAPAALLVAAAGALAGCSGGSSSQAVTGATAAPVASSGSPPVAAAGASPGAVASPGATTTVTSMTAFRSPTGNISCALSPVAGGGTYARCDLAKATWSAPEPTGGCAGQWGGDGHQGAVGLGSGPATVLCVTDSGLDKRAPVLPYGSAVRLGDVVCASSTTGVACDDAATHHGFAVARESHDLH